MKTNVKKPRLSSFLPFLLVLHIKSQLRICLKALVLVLSLTLGLALVD